jgi:hypothetical protein
MVAITQALTYAGLSWSLAYSYQALVMFRKNGGCRLSTLTVDLAVCGRQKRASR